jgi:Putative zinc-finger
MQCNDFREIVDSYLGNELSVETNHAVMSHLGHCAECRRELTARRDLRSKLREAFTKAPENQMRPEFADGLSKRLQTQALGTRSALTGSPHGWRAAMIVRRGRWLALAACLLLVTGLGLAAVWQRIAVQPIIPEVSRNPIPNYSPETGPGIPINLIKELAKSAVGDHRDCAIHFRLAEKPINLEVAGNTYDPVYNNLTTAVLIEENGAPLDAKFVEAHSCVFEGRRFAHIVLKYHDHLVSFLLTDTARTGETARATSPTSTRQQVISCSRVDGYQVSCFQTARHAVFIVSDLPEGENLALARALAPSVSAHINRAASAA